MKKIILPILTVALPALWSCQTSDLYSELPAPISHFVSKYWPNPAIESFTTDASGGYTVSVKNSITATFDKDYSWTMVDGDGMPLPQMFLSDQLPSKLYNYIQTTEALNQVFEVSRGNDIYNVNLLNSSVKYTVATEEISGSVQQ